MAKKNSSSMSFEELYRQTHGGQELPASAAAKIGGGTSTQASSSASNISREDFARMSNAGYNPASASDVALYNAARQLAADQAQQQARQQAVQAEDYRLINSSTPYISLDRAARRTATSAKPTYSRRAVEDYEQDRHYIEGSSYPMASPTPVRSSAATVVPEIPASWRSMPNAQAPIDQATYSRYKDLSAKASLSNEEMAEAGEAARRLAGAYGFDIQYGNAFGAPQEAYNLYTDLLYKSSAMYGVGAGLGSALGVDYVADKLGALAGDQYTPGEARRTTSKVSSMYPLPSAAGSLAGSLAMMGNAGLVAGAAVPSVASAASSAISKVLPETAAKVASNLLPRVLGSAATFGLTGAYSGLTKTMSEAEWDEQERLKQAAYAAQGKVYDPVPYSAWDQVGRVLADAGIGALGGAAGSIAGAVVGDIGMSVLAKRPDFQTTIAHTLIQALKGTAFAGGRLLSTYWLYPEDRRPSGAQIAQDMALSFVFSAITGAAESAKLSRDAKAFIDDATQKMRADYQDIIGRYDYMTDAERIRAIDDLRQYNDSVRITLQSTYYPGQGRRIIEILQGLDAVDEQLSIIQSGIGASQIGQDAGSSTAGSWSQPVAGDMSATAPDIIAQTAMDVANSQAAGVAQDASVVPPVVAPVVDRPAPMPVSDTPPVQQDNTPAPAPAASELSDDIPIAHPTAEQAQTVEQDVTPTEEINPATYHPTDDDLQIQRDRAAEIALEQAAADAAAAQTPPVQQPQPEAAVLAVPSVDTQPAAPANVPDVAQVPSPASDVQTEAPVAPADTSDTTADVQAANKRVATALKRVEEAGAVNLPYEDILTYTSDMVDAGLITQEQVSEAYQKGLAEYNRKQAAAAADNGDTDDNVIRSLRVGMSMVGDKDFTYSVTLADGGGYYAGITRDDAAMGGMISNARSQLYRSGPFATREEAVEDLIGVYQKNFAPAGSEETPLPASAADDTITIDAGDAQSNAAGDATAFANDKNGTAIDQSTGGQEHVDTEERTDAGVHEAQGTAPVVRGAGGEVLQGVLQAKLPESGSEGTGTRVPVLRKTRDESTRRADGSDAAGSSGGRSLGDSQGVAVSEGRGEHEVELEAEVKEDIEQTVTVKPKGSNYVIVGDLNLPSGDKSRYKANVEAIKIVKTLQSENRYATPEEQAALARYVGWGGLPSAFDAQNEKWAKEYAELKALLTPDEYKMAAGSTLNAHYTSVDVIRAMYEGLRQLGFQGGRMLEPSGGVGHFMGAMPVDMQSSVKSWTMVELDTITGNIAKYLYPNNDVRIEGFEQSKIPNNYMDVAIGNVPFGNYAITDKTYPKKVTSAIHNYFFAKSLSKVRPGGLVMFITSRYTMDAYDDTVRKYIMDNADLLGAIRLPDTAFKGNAGTEVVTDIIVLRKRAAYTPYNGESFAGTQYQFIGSGHNGASINEYFVNHPEMVLGTPELNGTMYGSNGLTYKALPGDLGKQIVNAFGKIEWRMEYPKQPSVEKINQETAKAEAEGKEGSLVEKGGKIYRIVDGALTEYETAKKKAATTAKILSIRDTARKLLDMQLQSASDTDIKAARELLNKAYDAFVKEHGYLNSPGNKRLYGEDVDAPFISSLENYDKKAKTASKADIFTKNTVSPRKTVTYADNTADALAVSVNETGGVDMKKIASLTGKRVDDVSRELLEAQLVYKNREGVYETAEKYLSGNVRAKLKDAESLLPMDKDYQRNIDALKKIIPADVPYQDIFVQPGVTWIPQSVYSDFVSYMLETYNGGYKQRFVMSYSPLTGEYTVKILDNYVKRSVANTSTWGTPDRSFAELFSALLNNRRIVVSRKDAEGKYYVDKPATLAAQEKAEAIKSEFQKWIWEDEARRDALAYLYNEEFNNTVTPTYNGENLTVDGMSALKQLRPHQKDVVHRIIVSGGNTLIAHKVGAGKTAEMAAAAMKLRQLGVVKKPMFVVPKSVLSQWGNEFLSFFPTAKILIPGDNDFTAKKRREFMNKIATGDYDAVIVSQENFSSIPVSTDTEKQFIEQQIEELVSGIEMAVRNGQRNDPTVKQMEKMKKQHEARLARLNDLKKDVGNISFEELGVDSLFVDEAHYYKNLFYTTNMNNVSGLGNKEGAKRSFDMYMKVRYLQRLNGGRGIVFATATPVMNSMSEMYIMQKYMQEDLLKQRGLGTFDAWANMFGEVVTVMEMDPSGSGYRQKESFSRFKNLGELQQMFRSFADVLIDVPGLKIPKIKGGKRTVVVSPASEYQLEYIKELSERAENVRKGRVNPKDDNMLKITSDGRKLSYSQRMMDPSLPYEEEGKIMKCVDNVYDIWKRTKKDRAAQLVFCDIATPKGGQQEQTNIENAAEDADNVSIYDDIKRLLILRGIPANEIAFIHDADTQEKKDQLFDDVNEGKVRVLIGSTGKMGVGMNAQKRLYALHHLDAPWRPGDIEQREGRILRQGNINEEVEIFTYVTEKTFDARMWDNLERKASFINSVMNGDVNAREAEDVGEMVLSFAEIKSIASGNPLIQEQFEVNAEIAKLNALKRQYTKSIQEAAARKAATETYIATAKAALPHIKKDIASRQDVSGDNFRATISGTTFTDRKKAGAAIISAAKKFVSAGGSDQYKTIGKIAGFDLLVSRDGDAVIRGEENYPAKINPESAVGTMQSIEAVIRNMDARLKALEENISSWQADVKKLNAIINAPFDRQDELNKATARNNEITNILNPTQEAPVIADEDEDADNQFMRDGSEEGSRNRLANVTPATRDESLSMPATDDRNVARYQNEITSALDGTMKSNQLILLGQPSQLLRKYLGSDKPLYMPQRAARKTAFSANEEGGKHGLGRVVLDELLYQFDDPMAITGNTTKHEELGDHSIVVWTDWKTETGYSIIVPIRIDVNGTVGTYNNVNTAFDLWNQSYVLDLLRKGNVLYTKNGKSIDELLTQRRQVPKWKPDNAFYKDNITGMADNVNPQNQSMWSTQRAGSRNVKTSPISDIIGRMRHDFGIPIGTGRMPSRGVRGLYNRHAYSVKSRIANDLPTVSHELGHHLDNMFSITDSLSGKLKNELVEQLSSEMKANNKESKHLTEGFAEFMRRYLQNTETAKIDFPTFFPYFESKLDANTLELLHSFADEINAYYSLDTDTAQSTIRDIGGGQRDYRTLAEKLTDTKNKMYQDWVDSFHGIKLFDRAAGTNVHMSAINSAYADVISHSVLTGNELRDLNGQVRGISLRDALKGINLKDPKELKAFGEYLIVKHGPERLAEGLRVFADDRKNSSHWMQNRQADLEEEYPNFADASEKLYEFQRDVLMAFGVETGLVSHESFDKWGERWQYYVPFNRAMDTEGGAGAAKRGFANQSSTIKKARGSGRDFLNPIENIINNTVKLVTAGIRNKVMQDITKAASENEGLANFIERVLTPMKVNKFGTHELKEQLVEDAVFADLTEDDFQKVLDVIEGIDDFLLQFKMGKAYGNTLTVLRNGKPEFWQVNDPLLLQSLTNMSQKDVNAVMRAYGTISRLMTSSITGLNLIWSIGSNTVRDLGTLITYSKDKNPAHIFAGLVEAYVNSVRKPDKQDWMYKEFLAMGGGSESAYTADKNMTRDIMKQLTGDKSRWLNPLEWIEYVSNIIERGPRYATYKMMREKGMSPQEAIYASHDITVNFRRGGNISRQMNMIVPFFNASVQGADKLVRWLRADDIKGEGREKARLARAIMYILFSVVAGAAQWLINSMDDDAKKYYGQLSNYTKNNFWAFPVYADGKHTGEYLTIPKPREIALPASLMSAAMEYFANGNRDAFREFDDYVAEAFLPNLADDAAKLILDLIKGKVDNSNLSDILGNLGIAGVFAYAAANRDFLGKPIESAYYQELESSARYNDRTSKLAYALGQGLNVSPMMIDYIGQNVFGGFWKAQKAVLPVNQAEADYSLGLGNTYVRDSRYSTDIINTMYDIRDAASQAHKTHPDDMDKAIAYKESETISSFYSRYNRLEGSNDPNTRQIVLDMIQEFNKSAASGERTNAQQAIDALCRSMNSTELMCAVMQPYIKDADGVRHDLTAAEYVEFQGLYNSAYWEYAERALNGTHQYGSDEIAIKQARAQAYKEATDIMLSRIGVSSGTPVTQDTPISFEDNLLFQTALDAADAQRDGIQKSEYIDALNQMPFTDEQKAYLYSQKNYSPAGNIWLTANELNSWIADERAAGKSDSSIARSITSVYKDLYIESVRSGDKARTREISRKLSQLNLRDKDGNLYYNADTFYNWIKAD